LVLVVGLWECWMSVWVPLPILVLQARRAS